jgi:hypothetical protein
MRYGEQRHNWTSFDDYFKLLIQDHQLVDLVPDDVVPTWRNGRTGGAGIAKILDRILAVESLLNDEGRYRSWVELPYVSDHAPMIAQFDLLQFLVAYPFKLNPSWMAEEEFSTIVKEVWKDTGFLVESDIQHRFVWKLKVLKARIKSWARHRRREKLLKLETLEEELRVGYSGLSRDGMDTTTTCHLKSLEAERNKILLLEEDYWRQKSRAIWLKCGDRNTIFFHKFASARRNQKHIWEINDESGQNHRGQEALKKEATRYFKKMYVAEPFYCTGGTSKLSQVIPSICNCGRYVLIERPSQSRRSGIS